MAHVAGSDAEEGDMRGKGRKVLLAVLIVLALGSKAFAQSGSLREYTGYQVMNLGTTDAHLLVDYYDANGDRLLTRSETIPAGGSKNIQQKTDDSALPSGIFSTVLMADQPIAAVMGQVESDPNVALAVYSAPFSDYTGVSFGSTKVTLPSLMKNWYGLDSRIRLQNVGNGTATVTIQYYAGTLGGQPTGASTIPPVTRTIPVHASITVDQSTKAGLEATSGSYQGRFLGSAIVTSDQPLASVADQIDQTDNLKYTYNGFGEDDAGTLLLAPSILYNWYSTFTSLAISNPSQTASVSVTITYKAASGSTYPSGSNAEGATRTVSFILAPGGSSTRYEGNSGGDLGPTFGKFSGSARISASGPVVAIVNQTQTTFTSNQKPSGTYNAARIDRLTQKAAVPLVQADFYGYYTSMACANASTTQAATVEFRYLSDSLSANPGVKATRTVTIPAGASIWAYERDRNGPLAHINTTTSPWYNPTLGTARFNGSAVVTSRTDGANIMCVVNEVGDSILYDNMNTYNGVAVLNSTGN